MGDRFIKVLPFSVTCISVYYVSNLAICLACQLAEMIVGVQGANLPSTSCRGKFSLPTSLIV